MDHEYVPFDVLQGVLKKVETEIGVKVTKMRDIVHQFERYQPHNYVYSCMEPLLKKAVERYNFMINRGYAALLGPDGNNHRGMDIYVSPSIRYYLTTPGRDFNLDFWYPFLEIYKSFLDRKFRRLTALIQDRHDELKEKNGLNQQHRLSFSGASAGIAALNTIMSCDWQTVSRIPNYEVVRYVIARIFLYCSNIQASRSRSRNSRSADDSPEYRSRIRDVKSRIDQIPEMLDYETELEGAYRSPRLRIPPGGQSSSSKPKNAGNSNRKAAAKSPQEPPKREFLKRKSVKLDLPTKTARRDPSPLYPETVGIPKSTGKGGRKIPATLPPEPPKREFLKRKSLKLELPTKVATSVLLPPYQGAEFRAKTTGKGERKTTALSPQEPSKRPFLKRKSVRLELPKGDSATARGGESQALGMPTPSSSGMPTPSSSGMPTASSSGIPTPTKPRRKRRLRASPLKTTSPKPRLM